MYFFSANVSKEDEGFINQQGVHELFADILFADPSEWDDDSSMVCEIFKERQISWNRNIFSVLQIDEDALFSSNRSFEDWQDEIEAELDSNGDDINLERSKYDSKPGTPTYDSRSELSRFELKAEKNRKNRAILKLLTQKMDGTQE